MRKAAVLAVAGLVLAGCERVGPDPLVGPETPSLSVTDVVFGLVDHAPMAVGDPCALPGADEDGNLIFGGIGEITFIGASRGTAIMRCEGSGLTNLSGANQYFAGFGCNMLLPDGTGVFTTDTEARLTTGGDGHMVCRSQL